MKKLILLLIVFLFVSNAHADEIAVIVNEGGPLAEISEEDIREIYLGNMRFVKGVALTPINYGEGPVKDSFVGSVLKMTPREYRSYWVKKVFQEGVQSPVSQGNSALIILAVRKISGAIGYVPKSELGDIKGVKIIAVIKR